MSNLYSLLEYRGLAIMNPMQNINALLSVPTEIKVKYLMSAIEAGEVRLCWLNNYVYLISTRPGMDKIAILLELSGEDRIHTDALIRKVEDLIPLTEEQLEKLPFNNGSWHFWDAFSNAVSTLHDVLYHDVLY